ncbi:mevalonate kinase [Xylariaceae sp. FL0016]|nr:mevalonate kinase [Xylariaceae sp. FL0016]
MTRTPTTPDSDDSSAEMYTNGVNGSTSDSDMEVNGNGNGHLSSGRSSGESMRKKLQRKHSSPMMPPFMVSAPGKVIVFGEHAVVYGKAAIAASISLRSYLHVTTLSKSRRTICLRFPDIDFSHTWTIDDLPWNIFSHPSKKKYYYDLVTSVDPELVEAIQPHLNDISPHKPENIRKIHRNSAASFLYLFLSLGSRKFPGCIYTLRSTIPIGAGLGSSASIAVCLAAALLLQIRTLSGPHPDQPPDEARLQIERINRWAFVAEMYMHGNPSGVDNTVATQGKAVVYQRTDYAKPPVVTPLWDFPELPLLLVDTRVPKSTAAEVAKVAKLKTTHQKLVGSIIEAVDTVTRTAESLIAEDDFDAEEYESLRRVGELMSINHGLLMSLGVSHPRLERIRELIDFQGMGWSKLTGAGGGGCSITLMQPNTSRVRREALEEQLEVENYQIFKTTLGGNGVGVLWPAVLKNGLDEDDEGGMEIDLEKFLNAPGTDGVEKLVGVHGGTGENEGWKFWRVESE